jgi:hypothetical protein
MITVALVIPTVTLKSSNETDEPSKIEAIYLGNLSKQFPQAPLESFQVPLFIPQDSLLYDTSTIHHHVRIGKDRARLG